MRKLQPKSNIANKVRNTNLPKTRPLMPLFELISNSIHAINEAKKKEYLKDNGKILVNIIRQGSEENLKGAIDIDTYPIKSFEVIDNGIGLDEENLNYFIESDTDHKIEIGGKGVGRFVCLKAFDHLVISSQYYCGNKVNRIEFIFNNTKEGFSDIQEIEDIKNKSIGTKIILNKYKEEYQKNAPRSLSSIAREIIIHFQLYFIQEESPELIVTNQNNDFINCSNYFEKHFRGNIMSKDFFVSDNEFILYLTRSQNSLSHKIHFCAHNRSVREEGLFNRIPDLGKYSIKDPAGHFYYQAFVVGKALDDNVGLERVGFDFPTEEDETETNDELTLAKVRKEAVNTIEILLTEYLNKIREEKIEKYFPVVQEDLPQYKFVFHHKTDEIKKLQPNLPKERLDIELYRIESNWKMEVKELGIKIIEESKDIQNLEEYKIRYEQFLSDFNEVGKSDLARYIVHRKAVIELLESLLDKDNDDKFSNEDIIHSVFFPIRSSSDEIPYDKQNLWLLDERLTFHSFLASDKKFSQIKNLNSESNNRSDLLIFNAALAFSETKSTPFNSFTIIEFKKPQRDNYEDYDPKKNPLDQAEQYIKDILGGKITNRSGRKITVDPRMPFYVYIVCDITPTLLRVLESREFDKTPDGFGYFKPYTKYFNAYIEVLPFEKVLYDAKKRNRILFEKLGIPQ